MTALAWPLAGPASAAERYQASQPHMGTGFTITLYAADEAAARGALQAAFGRIGELDRKLSDYKPNSELNRLCRQAPTARPVEISEDLYRVLSAAERVSRDSEGAFDVTVGPLTRLWRTARKQKAMPPTDALAEARAAVGYRNVTLSEQNGKFFASLAKPRMQIDLGGIAKGYALDQALAALRSRGIESALVDGGGDLALGAPPPDSAGWRIGVAPLEPGAAPSSHFVGSHCGIATSGDAWQFVELNGRRYSHLVDPHTGLGLEQRSSVTVVAPTGMQADALASAVSVLGPKAGIELIDRTEHVEAIVVIAEEAGAKKFTSRGIEALLETGEAETDR